MWLLACVSVGLLTVGVGESSLLSALGTLFLVLCWVVLSSFSMGAYILFYIFCFVLFGYCFLECVTSGTVGDVFWEQIGCGQGTTRESCSGDTSHSSVT